MIAVITLIIDADYKDSLGKEHEEWNVYYPIIMMWHQNKELICLMKLAITSSLGIQTSWID